ncbi:MAG: PspA/IM30 family protein [Phreatobacter sp.]
MSIAMMDALRTDQSTLRYALAPDATAALAIEETFADYGLMLSILAELSPDGGANLVALHDLAYGTIRQRTRLPSRLVTLGLRDFASNRTTAGLGGLPLDEKLFAIKGPSALTIATVYGRIVVPFDIRGYAPGWNSVFPARLVASGGRYEIEIGVVPKILPMEQKMMVQEGILSRMGRLIAGVANAAIDKAEGTSKVAVVEQAIREIDAAADEARVDLGKARAEEYRIQSRRSEIHADLTALDDKIRLAVAEGRDDLAKAAVARQIDLESQVAALDKALADAAARIDDGQKAMQAVLATRREAEARLAELKRSIARHAPEESSSRSSRPSAELGAARAAAAVSRVTGVPQAEASGAAELDELDRLHRERAIEARLARFKSGG